MPVDGSAEIAALEAFDDDSDSGSSIEIALADVVEPADPPSPSLTRPVAHYSSLSPSPIDSVELKNQQTGAVEPPIGFPTPSIAISGISSWGHLLAMKAKILDIVVSFQLPQAPAIHVASAGTTRIAFVALGPRCDIDSLVSQLRDSSGLKNLGEPQLEISHWKINVSEPHKRV